LFSFQLHLSPEDKPYTANINAPYRSDSILGRIISTFAHLILGLIIVQPGSESKKEGTGLPSFLGLKCESKQRNINLTFAVS